MEQKILLVEDSKDLGEALRISLSQNGYTILLSPTVKEALNLFKKESPDLLILDILLEDGNGIDLLKKIRSEYGNKVPVIILTNIDKDKEIYEAGDLAVAYYLIKTNIKLEEISEKVKSLISVEESN